MTSDVEGIDCGGRFLGHIRGIRWLGLVYSSAWVEIHGDARLLEKSVIVVFYRRGKGRCLIRKPAARP